MPQPHIVLLGPSGPGRHALRHTLAGLGCRVTEAEPLCTDVPPAEGGVLVADLREPGAGWAGLEASLRRDPRPLVVVADRPRRLVRSLLGRAGGTLVMTGAESEAGYRVALSVCQGLCAAAGERAALDGGSTRRRPLFVRTGAG